MVDDPAIEAILAEVPDPEAASAALVGAANLAGGVDNITVVVVAVEDDPKH
jgi:serine/threonine protein phosphatase PrpC